MSEIVDPAEPIVGFERHPAAIERHLGAGSAVLARSSFTGITTWSPYPPLPPSWAEPPVEDWEVAPAAPALRAAPAVAPPPVPAREPAPPRPDLVESTPARMWTAPGEPPPPPRPAPTPDPAPFVSEAEWPPPFDHGVAEPPPVTPPPPRLAQAPPAPPSVARQRGELLWPNTPVPSRPFDDRFPADEAWEDELDGQDTQPQARPGRPWLRRAALAAAAIVAGGVFAGLRAFPDLLRGGRTVTAVFNAPMMVVRAAANGRVLTVTANAGQIVEPGSPLMTIHAEGGGPDRPILAGVNGVVRSVETVPGAELASGTPLVRLQDCDRAFLTVPPTNKFTPGEAVEVRLPNLPALSGTMRASSGIMEPPDTLVVGLAPRAIAGTCPVGASATVTPRQG